MGTSVSDSCMSLNHVPVAPTKALERPAELGLAPANQGKANGAVIAYQVFAAYLGLLMPTLQITGRRALLH